MTPDPTRTPDKRQFQRFNDPRFLEIFNKNLMAPGGQELVTSAPRDFLELVERVWYAELILDVVCGVDRRPLTEPESATKPFGSQRWTYVDHLQFVEAVDAARASRGTLKAAFEAVQRLDKYKHITALKPRYAESKKIIRRCAGLAGLLDPDETLKLAAQIKAGFRRLTRAERHYTPHWKRPRIEEVQEPKANPKLSARFLHERDPLDPKAHERLELKARISAILNSKPYPHEWDVAELMKMTECNDHALFQRCVEEIISEQGATAV